MLLFILKKREKKEHLKILITSQFKDLTSIQVKMNIIHHGMVSLVNSELIYVLEHMILNSQELLHQFQVQLLKYQHHHLLKLQNHPLKHHLLNHLLNHPSNQRHQKLLYHHHPLLLKHQKLCRNVLKDKQLLVIHHLHQMLNLLLILKYQMKQLKMLLNMVMDIGVDG